MIDLDVTAAHATVTTPAYRLSVRRDRPRAVLTDPAGTVWSDLSLLASADRIDRADESFSIGQIEVREVAGAVEFVVEAQTPAWDSKRVVLRAEPDAVRLRVEIAGSGRLDRLSLGGGRAVLDSGACGTFRSSVAFASLFVPTPTEPVQVVRPATSPAVIGVVGDAEPGRLHGIFSPPPLCYAFGRPTADSPTGIPTAEADPAPWLGLSLVAGLPESTFTLFGYDVLDGGWLATIDYEGHTPIEGEWTSPELVLRPAVDPWAAIGDYRADLDGRGHLPRPGAEGERGANSAAAEAVPTTGAVPTAAVAQATEVGTAADTVSAVSTPEVPAWWREPIFCGWGAQCALAATNARAAMDVAATTTDGAAAAGPADAFDPVDPATAAPAGFVGGPGSAHAPDLSRQELYDHWLDVLAGHGIVPGTVVVDDRWQEEYGTCRTDEEKWPDLPGWIARRHRQGQRVLLWFKVWDHGGLPADECVTIDGRPVAVDPSNPDYLRRLADIVTRLISPDGLDADGFKMDFTQRAPSGRVLRSYGDEHGGGAWGLSALHAVMATVHRAATSVKPDALIINHTVNPLFADVTDMVRLNDVLERDPAGHRVPVADQVRFRARVARAALPGTLIDTDQWPMPDKAEWLAYAETQADLGVPALYYVESIDNSGEPIEPADLARVAATWTHYRATCGLPEPTVSAAPGASTVADTGESR